MSYLAQIRLIYPAFLCNKVCFTRMWVAIFKSLSNYEIVQKIIKKYLVDPKLYTKNMNLGPNLP